VLRQNINAQYNFSHSASDNRNIFLPLGGATESNGYFAEFGLHRQLWADFEQCIAELEPLGGRDTELLYGYGERSDRYGRLEHSESGVELCRFALL